MKGFNFRLQRVLELREKKEEHAATELAAAQDAAAEARAAHAALEEVRRATREQAMPGAGGGAPVGMLHNLSYLLERMDHHLAHAAGTVQSAEGQVQQAMNRYTAALQERRVMDRLRERDLEAFRAAEVQADRSAMDSIALTRFALAGVARRGAA